MDDIYLVEIRLGRTRWRVNKAVSDIARIFGILPFMEHHPHVTLFGPFELAEEIGPSQLLEAIGSVASRYDPIPFLIGDFETRKGMHGSVIAFSVTPSDMLTDLTTKLVAALLPHTITHNAWDARPDQKWYHVTIANRLDHAVAESVYSALTGDLADGKSLDPSGGVLFRLRTRIRQFLYCGSRHSIRPLLLDETGLRITVLHGDVILAEYDLLEKRWITGDHRQSGKGWQATLSRFRKQAGFESPHAEPSKPDDILLLADLHLGHANIIRYCSRPFFVFDPGEMDRVLIANWNAAVPEGTRAYHLGDFYYGRYALPEEVYRSQMTGKITFISGNHDPGRPGLFPSAEIEHNGLKFFLVHDPVDAPAGFDGWIIHGHHHNNDLAHYPFIDFVHRRINVSAEVTGYVPVSLAGICEVIHYRDSTGNKEPVLLHYPYTERT
jgi:calcineurin-like phosphoesterase family protein